MYNSVQSINQVSSSMEKVELFLSARKLLDMDFFSKSDPYVKVYFKPLPTLSMNYIGRTQTIQNNLNPNFKKSFILDFIFQSKQQIKFQVYDEDDNKNDKNDDFIGSVTTTLGALTGAKNQTSLLDIIGTNRKSTGKLIIRIEPCSVSNQYIQMKFRAQKLLNTDSFFDFWDKSDPYLKFLKIREDNTYIQINRTQIIMDNLNPNWKNIQLSLGKLISKNNKSGKFKIQCWDWEEKGQDHHQFIGQIFVELQKLKSINKFPFQLPLFNPNSKKPGKLILENLAIFSKPSFIDYLRGGLQLNLSICIDFTGSNGIPTHPTSLHYLSQNKPNQYQMAIQAVSKILLNYDSDQRIPAFGFGAKPRYPYFSSNSTNHCFPLSGDINQIEAFGLEHLMGLYNQARSSVQLSGPTLFTPLLRQVVKLAKINAEEGSKTYQILLILTDGQIHDMEQTIDLLVKNCNLPLSIIIVGVGNAQFTNMVRLDGDNGLYNSMGQKAARDIVQFVPFRQVSLNPDQLAKQLLEELPGQVVQYMSLIGKPPGKPIELNVDNLFNQDIPSEDILKQQLADKFKQANFFGLGASKH